MNLFKLLYYNFSALLPTALLTKAAGSPALFPYQHLVSDKEVLHIKHLYPCKNTKQFTEDLDCLLQRFQPLAVTDLQDAISSGKKIPSNSFLLTFDDGFREVYDVIAPILLKKGVPAIFFINPAFIDNRELFYRCKISLLIEQVYRNKNNSSLLQQCAKVLGNDMNIDASAIASGIKKITNFNQEITNQLATVFKLSYADYLEQEQPFLTTSQLVELTKQGFTIGAHSWDHPYYDLLSNEEKLLQTKRSVTFVTEKVRPKVTTFSFPHFDTNIPQSFFSALPQACHVDLLFGIQNQKKELQNKMLHRFNAERPDMPLKKQLNGILLLMILRELTGRNSVVRA
jgi:peptidoglycan/xylan/chitin deacetylase (PgdA/CDA1 family)